MTVYISDRTYLYLRVRTSGTEAPSAGQIQSAEELARCGSLRRTYKLYSLYCVQSTVYKRILMIDRRAGFQNGSAFSKLQADCSTVSTLVAMRVAYALSQWPGLVLAYLGWPLLLLSLYL